MTKNFDSQRRDDSRPSSRNQSSGRYGDSRPPRPARPRLNRETVDRAWENGASRDHADYHPRQTNERSSSQRRPYGRDGNAPSPNSRRPYSQGRGDTGYDNQRRGDARPSPRPYGDRRGPGNRSFNDSERSYGNRNERSSGYAGGEQRPYRRYEDNRAPARRYEDQRTVGRRYGDNSDPNQRSPRRYDNERTPDQRPPRRYEDNRAPSYRPPRREYDDRAPYQRPPRRFDNDRAPGYRSPRREYDDRAPRKEYRQPADGQRRDSSDFQVAPSEDGAAEDGLTEGEQFQGDYERFNEEGAPSPAKRPASPRGQRKLHTTWSKTPHTKAGHEEHKPRAKAEAKPAHKKVKRAAKAKPSPATRPWQKGYKWPDSQEHKSED